MQKKEKTRKKFRVTVIDDQTHEGLWTIKFTRNNFIVTVVSAVVLFSLFIFALTAFTPIRTVIPGYPDAHSKRAAILNAMRTDSLVAVIKSWEYYAENLRRVLDGEEPVSIDSLMGGLNAAAAAAEVTTEVGTRDSALRETVVREEQFGLYEKERRQLPIEGMHFFVPLKGMVSQGYDKIVHPYIDITAPANSVVMAVLDGTVIFAGWNDEAGYTIQIQHENDIVSTYKHNQKLLKNTGDKVTAGSPIALVGNTGSLSTGDHLHFELWYKGEAVDPTLYINF